MWRKLLFLSLVLALWVLGTGRPAVAAPPNQCNLPVEDDANVEATNNSGLEQFKGMKASVWVGTWNDDCVRVSSIGPVKADGRFIEWGWHLGYEYA